MCSFKHFEGIYSEGVGEEVSTIMTCIDAGAEASVASVASVASTDHESTMSQRALVVRGPWF